MEHNKKELWGKKADPGGAAAEYFSACVFRIRMEWSVQAGAYPAAALFVLASIKSLLSKNLRKQAEAVKIWMPSDHGKLLQRAAIHQEGKVLVHVCFMGSGVFAVCPIFGQNIAYLVELLRRMV